LQIQLSSLIITSLFEIRRASAAPGTVLFSISQSIAAIVHEKELHGKAF
jgi:hypothetical protein